MTTDHSKITFLDYLTNGLILSVILIAVGSYLIFSSNPTLTDEEVTAIKKEESACVVERLTILNRQIDKYDLLRAKKHCDDIPSSHMRILKDKAVTEAVITGSLNSTNVSSVENPIKKVELTAPKTAASHKE